MTPIKKSGYSIDTDDGRRQWLVIRCPKCRTLQTIGRVASRVSPDGAVSGTIQCRGVECAFRDTIRLEGLERVLRPVQAKWCKRFRAALGVIALSLGLTGCSLIKVNGKAIDELVKRMPQPLAPIVQGPPAEKIIDWYDLGALALMGLGGMAHRYYFHRKRGGVGKN